MGLRHLHSVVGCPPFPHTHTSQGIKVPQTLSLGQSFCLLRTLIPKTQWAEEGRRGEGRREKRRRALWWWEAVMPKPTWSSPGGNPQVGHWTAWAISLRKPRGPTGDFDWCRVLFHFFSDYIDPVLLLMLWQSNYRLLSCWANSRTLSVNPLVTQAPTLGHCHYTQPTPWCAGQPRHTLCTSFMMRLELEVLGVSQTGFLFFRLFVNIWGNWGPEQWLKQCRSREEIWDLGKGGWCVKVSFLPSFPPSLFYFLSFLLSLSSLPSFLSFF